jgi:hypothetical protein
MANSPTSPKYNITSETKKYSSQLGYGYDSTESSQSTEKTLARPNLSSFEIGFVPIKTYEAVAYDTWRFATRAVKNGDPIENQSTTRQLLANGGERKENELRTALRRMVKIHNETPPLKFIINPQNFSVNYEHTTDVVYGRRSQISSMWLPKPQRITMSGVTPAHYFLSASSGSGLTHTQRTETLSYAFLNSLIHTYRSNGIIYCDDSILGQNGIPLAAGAVYIKYGGNLYIGSFDSMSITDEAEKPYNFAYSLEFTARYITYNVDKGGQ